MTVWGRDKRAAKIKSVGKIVAQHLPEKSQVLLGFKVWCGRERPLGRDFNTIIVSCKTDTFLTTF